MAAVLRRPRIKSSKPNFSKVTVDSFTFILLLSIQYEYVVLFQVKSHCTIRDLIQRTFMAYINALCSIFVLPPTSVECAGMEAVLSLLADLGLRVDELELGAEWRQFLIILMAFTVCSLNCNAINFSLDKMELSLILKLRMDIEHACM